MKDFKGSKDSETCNSISCGSCGPDCFEVKVIDTFTGDSRIVYSGENRIKALNLYQEFRFSDRFEVEFYKNGEIRFYS